jgi:hypothetical protein
MKIGEHEGRLVKRAKAAKRKVGRPSTGINRRVLAMRVHEEELYGPLQEMAEQAKIPVSEMAVRVLATGLAYKKRQADFDKALSGSNKNALRDLGYQPYHLPDGTTVWLEPGAHAGGVMHIIRQAIREIVQEDVQKAITNALKREREG